jgi:hypothetical protein
MLGRIFRVVAFVALAVVLAGPVLLVTCFVVDPATRPYLRWMLGTGIGMTAVN